MKHRWLPLFLLILSGEVIFLLPFVIARVFRPTLLQVFQIDNLQLGSFFSLYGIIGMLSYFFGGPLADRFAARKLMASSLLLTSLGGFYLYTLPSAQEMHFLYAFWGFTTIFLFWASLIKATREWGGEAHQGRAFGFLDGGRGLAAALLGTAAAFIFSGFLTGNATTASLSDKTEALQGVILFFSCFTLVTSVLVWLFLQTDNSSDTKQERMQIGQIWQVLQMPTVWLQAMIILSAYSGYKLADNFPQYASDVLGFSEVKSAVASTVLLWVRPFAAVTAGILADKISSNKLIAYSFTMMSIGGLLLGAGWFAGVGVFFAALLFIGSGMFAMRGLYFAIMQEGNIPLQYTGTAVGIVSVLGYTPEIFIGPLMGYLLEYFPKEKGHAYLFLILTAFSLIGLLVNQIFSQYKKN
ncbi:MAG: MFS transporter [Spirochaetota bacterium]